MKFVGFIIVLISYSTFAQTFLGEMRSTGTLKQSGWTQCEIDLLEKSPESVSLQVRIRKGYSGELSARNIVLKRKNLEILEHVNWDYALNEDDHRDYGPNRDPKYPPGVYSTHFSHRLSMSESQLVYRTRLHEFVNYKEVASSDIICKLKPGK